MIKIAHLSDPHFGNITWNPAQFLSKRWIGNVNLLVARNQFHDTSPLFSLPEFLKTLDVDHVFFTGDFSSTSLDVEFEMARGFLSSFKQRLYLVPGNHDVYTKKAEKEKTFYSYFPNVELEKRRVTKIEMSPGFWAVGLDCALATPPFFSYGRFLPEMEKSLEEVLAGIPERDSVIVFNHFPLTSHGNVRHDLRGNQRLENVLKGFPNIRLYLHGHDHDPYIEDRRNEGLPLVCNSGSCSRKKNGGFSVVTVGEKTVEIERFVYKGVWQRENFSCP